jgi:hypothetical protein
VVGVDLEEGILLVIILFVIMFIWLLGFFEVGFNIFNDHERLAHVFVQGDFSKEEEFLQKISVKTGRTSAFMISFWPARIRHCVLEFYYPFTTPKWYWKAAWINILQNSFSYQL